MTLLEMQTYFQALLAETTTSSDFVSSPIMTDFINEGCEVFGIETKIVRPTYQEIALATGDRAYDLEATFLALAEGVFLYDASGNYQWEMTSIEEGYKTIIQNDSDNGSPTRYNIRGFTKALISDSPVQNINIEPPPSSSFNGFKMRVYYCKKPVTLSGATDISDIPIQFHRGPVPIAVALFKERDQELEQASYYWKRADYWIKKAKREMHNWDRIPTGFRFSEGNYVR